MGSTNWLYHDIGDDGHDWGETYDLDFGDGHYLRFTGWREPHSEPPEHDGAIVIHVKADEPHGYCSGSINFDTPATRHHLEREAEYMRTTHPDLFAQGRYPRPMWQVSSWAPLTMSPSLLCHCGDHGFIREGRWVRA